MTKRIGDEMRLARKIAYNLYPYKDTERTSDILHKRGIAERAALAAIHETMKMVIAFCKDGGDISVSNNLTDGEHLK